MNCLCAMDPLSVAQPYALVLGCVIALEMAMTELAKKKKMILDGELILSVGTS